MKEFPNLKASREKQLYETVWRGFTNHFHYLVGENVDLNSVYYGRNLAHVATHFEHVEILKTLIEKGVTLDMIDKDGLKPIDYAKRRNNPSLVKLIEEQISRTQELMEPV